jgi:hypothetical protein
MYILVSFIHCRHSVTLRTRTWITICTVHGAFPLLCTPLAGPLLLFSFVPFLTPFYLLGTLLAVTGSVHLSPRLFVNWPPLTQPFSLPPSLSQLLKPVTPRLTTTTLGITRHLLSGTVISFQDPSTRYSLSRPKYTLRQMFLFKNYCKWISFQDIFKSQVYL